MKFRPNFYATVALAALVSFSQSASAQESDTMVVGGVIVSVGGGTAILDLPDFKFTSLLDQATGNAIRQLTDDDDFSDEYGWNINGSIVVPLIGPNSAPKHISLNGFWASINDGDSLGCSSVGGVQCAIPTIIDRPGIDDIVLSDAGFDVTTRTEREVEHWGVSMESKWTLNPGIMGVTRAQHRRTFAVGADVRGIDQDTSLAAFVNFAPVPVAGVGNVVNVDYKEDLDARYYGAYAAWGGDYSLPFVSGLANRLGLQSSFLLRGGIYYADTDYDGRQVFSGRVNQTQSLSLSREDAAFIGGIVLETKKRIGKRASLSLKSEYEFYSYVPEMLYNNNDNTVGAGVIGTQAGTSIDSDDAFSAKTSLRLSIKLGPDSIF